MSMPMASKILFVATLTLALLRPAAAQRAADDPVAARVGDRTITVAEVDRVAMVQESSRFRGLRLRDAIYESRKSALDRLIAEHLIDTEAARASVTAAALVDREVARTVAAVTDRDVDEWYQANQSRVGGATLEQIAGKIRQALEEQRRDDATTRYVARLRAAATIDVSLAPPRESIDVGETEPSAGPANAPVQIVIYSDFQCPFCARVGPTLKRVQQAYGDRVRVIFRDFPLTSIHPRATAAAAAAHCAHAQGRF